MKIGVVKEIKTHEYRVAATPAGVEELVKAGHSVLVQSGAGLGSGLDDDAYLSAGAEFSPDAEGVFAAADMILKVKEPLPSEWPLLRSVGRDGWRTRHDSRRGRQPRALPRRPR